MGFSWRGAPPLQAIRCTGQDTPREVCHKRRLAMMAAATAPTTARAPRGVCGGKLLLLLLLLAAALAPASSHASAQLGIPDAPAWASIQQARLQRLELLLHGILSTGSGGALATPSSNLGGHALVASDEWEQPPSSQRELLQLSGALTTTEAQRPSGALTTTTIRNSRFTAPDGSLHAVGEEYSEVSAAVPQQAGGASNTTTTVAAAAEQLAQRLASLAAASSALLDSAPEPLLSVAADNSTQPLALQPTLRIVGGVEAPTDRKYVCSLRTPTTTSPSDYLFCGCSLIAPNVVLTAAHCLANPDLRTPWVEIGRYYQQRPNDTTTNSFDRIKCAAGVPHSAYSASLAQNDIGLCFLESSSRFEPVMLAEEATTKLTSGQQLTVMGWGAVSEGGEQSPGLLTVDVETTDLESCNAAYNNVISGQTQICAGVPQGGKDACQGDSGGPLVIKGLTAAEDVQVGLVSYGIGCGRPSLPGIYTDVRAFRAWIAQQMLARGVTFAPVTAVAAGSNASDTVDQAAACACTTDGNSGSTFLGADLAGCKQHGLSVGDSDFYCYTQAGSDCLAATQSTAYPGAAWMDCTPQVAKTQGAAAANNSSSSSLTTVSGSQPVNQNLATATTASLLGSWLGQMLAWSVYERTGPANNTATQPAAAAANRTAAAATATKVTRRVAQPAAASG